MKRSGFEVFTAMTEKSNLRDCNVMKFTVISAKADRVTATVGVGVLQQVPRESIQFLSVVQPAVQREAASSTSSKHMQYQEP
jgi:hypothetical protein